MNSYEPGESIVFEIDVKKGTTDPRGALAYANPSSGVKVTVFDSKGATIVDDASATLSQYTGKYYYTYAIPSSPTAYGVWLARLKADDSGNNWRNIEFEVKRPKYT